MGLETVLGRTTEGPPPLWPPSEPRWWKWPTGALMPAITSPPPLLDEKLLDMRRSCSLDISLKCLQSIIPLFKSNPYGVIGEMGTDWCIPLIIHLQAGLTLREVLAELFPPLDLHLQPPLQLQILLLSLLLLLEVLSHLGLIWEEAKGSQEVKANEELLYLRGAVARTCKTSAMAEMLSSKEGW